MDGWTDFSKTPDLPVYEGVEHLYSQISWELFKRLEKVAILSDGTVQTDDFDGTVRKGDFAVTGDVIATEIERVLANRVVYYPKTDTIREMPRGLIIGRRVERAWSMRSGSKHADPVVAQALRDVIADGDNKYDMGSVVAAAASKALAESCEILSSL